MSNIIAAVLGNVSWAPARIQFSAGTLVVSVCQSCPDAFRMILRRCGLMKDHCTSIQTLDRCSSRGHLLKVRISKPKRPPVCFWWNLDGWVILHRSADASIIRLTCCDLNIKLSSFYHRLKRSVQNNPKGSLSVFFKSNPQNAWRWSESITSPAVHSSRHAQPEASLAPSLAMTPAHAGFGVASGCAWIWSEQSHGAGEASHASLGAQRGLSERQGNGWEVRRWLIITHICSSHFFQSYLWSVPLILISTLCLSLSSLFDCCSKGRYLNDSPLAEGGP